ncbi:aromatic acid exporter family protein [Ornithinibacillus salinisoli]|uniref:Aromatic acid exporter family protein n=1 Tax=Ornithinibacillus salinisoli TaxID=1848459 RepID=A0ABW4VZT5_9BACI
MKLSQFIGNRLIKTAIAILITAWICDIIGWPPVFAVITAIVTLEPTVSESIKKGMIRFPASAIGSAFAVIFIALFGNSPITYTLAAFFTIATCVKLRLHAGVLVATLTAVAMVEVIYSNFLISFFIRLGTTTIGLVVSTAVNMFLLPPDYTHDIVKHIKILNKKTGKLIEDVFENILFDEDVKVRDRMGQLRKALNKTETLIRFQKEETKYHPLVGHEKHVFQHAQDQILNIRMMHYHIENLINTPIDTVSWTKEEREIIHFAIKKLSQSMEDEKNYNIEDHEKQLKQLTEIFWEDNEEITKNNKHHPTHFPPELIILYELLSIFELITAFYINDNSTEKTV